MMAKPIEPTPALCLEDWLELQEQIKNGCSLEEMKRRQEAGAKFVERITRAAEQRRAELRRKKK